MAVVAFTSISGAAGVTAATLACAVHWPRPTLVLEADTNAVGSMLTGFFRSNLGGYDDPKVLQAMIDFTPMGRVAETAEIKGPALFLASAASDFMTGQTLVVDGGCMAK